jgi:hypothetical protein
VSSESTRDELLAAVKASPAAVAAHDRAGWIGLFASDGQVNDPVGSRPHQGREAIRRFYDTFIAPNTIIFHVDHDIVCGNSVVRDLSIETIMSTGAALKVPMHLRYDLVKDGASLKIQRLYAHWELGPMISQMLGLGAKGLWTSTKLGVQMTQHLGIGGALGFSQGFRGVGTAGKRRVEAFHEALSAGDASGAASQLTADAKLEWPNNRPCRLEEFVGKTRGSRWRKLLAAGYCVTASFTLADGATPGVAIFEFNPPDRLIRRVRIFLPDGDAGF